MARQTDTAVMYRLSSAREDLSDLKEEAKTHTLLIICTYKRRTPYTSAKVRKLLLLGTTQNAHGGQTSESGGFKAEYLIYRREHDWRQQ